MLIDFDGHFYFLEDCLLQEIETMSLPGTETVIIFAAGPFFHTVQLM